MEKRLHFTVWLTALVFFLCTSPAFAAVEPLLTSLNISVNGASVDLLFQAHTTEYQVTVYSDTAIPVTIDATAGANCTVYLESSRSQLRLPQTLTLMPDTTTSLLLTVVDANSQQTIYRLDLTVSPQEKADQEQDDCSPSDENDKREDDPIPDDDLATKDETETDTDTDTDTDIGSQTVSPDMIHLIMYINAPFYFLNDAYREMDAAPYLVTDARGDGYTMVPLRFVAESLGAKVSWTAASKTVGIDLDGQHFQLVIGQLVPGTPVAATITHDRTFVPLRYVMESFGALVFWSQSEKRIDIYYLPKSPA